MTGISGGTSCIIVPFPRSIFLFSRRVISNQSNHASDHFHFSPPKVSVAYFMPQWIDVGRCEWLRDMFRIALRELPNDGMKTLLPVGVT